MWNEKEEGDGEDDRVAVVDSEIVGSGDYR